MAPKMIVCSICGENVLKSQTVAISPAVSSDIPASRACKIHPEAIKLSESLKDAERQRIKDMVTPKPPKKSREEKMEEEMEERRVGIKKCWCCGASGIYINEWSMVMFTISSVIKSENLYSEKGKEFVKNYFIQTFGCDLKPLHLVKSEDITKIKGKERFRQLREMVDYSPICHDCLKIHKHEHLWPRIELNPEQLKKWMVVSEMASETIRETIEQEVKTKIDEFFENKGESCNDII